ncbi:hypothetical protein A5636_09455 [Mycobacterium asiaticum]|uniref:DUF4190 domain-containing protein n=1 Tax=Mycobacterium asiaticum TaxID=1790 RepID=A0A1A3MXH3_MYCAS|nr:hypothetical protein A5636_09455 [Mycobacterium asiaticum]
MASQPPSSPPGSPPPTDPPQYAPPAGPPPAGPAQHAHPPYPVNRSTNSMAIAALVTSLVLAPLGIVFGHISLSQIKRTGEDGRGFAIAGLVLGYLGTAFGIIGLIAVLIFMTSMSSALHSSKGSRYRSTPTTSETPVGVPDASARAIKDARVGDCIRRVTGARNKDGTSQVTVSSASCGSSSATDKVTKRTTSTSSCPSGQWVRTTAYKPPIVLCLSKLR